MWKNLVKAYNGITGLAGLNAVAKAQIQAYKDVQAVRLEEAASKVREAEKLEDLAIDYRDQAAELKDEAKHAGNVAKKLEAIFNA